MPGLPSLSEWWEEAQAADLVGPGPIDPHLQRVGNFLAAAARTPHRFVDLGTGAGMPGLVLALHWSDAEAVLIDASQRRADFVRHWSRRLDLDQRVSVLHGRAEELGRERSYRHGFDLAVARSFAPPAVTAECAAGFLIEGGALLVAEPPRGTDQQRWRADRLVPLGMAVGPRRYGIQVVEQVETCSAAWPRRPGVPDKRPLW